MKTILLLLITGLLVQANGIHGNLDGDRIIIEKMLGSIQNSKKIKVYIQDENFVNIIKKSKILIRVKSCEEADFTLLNEGSLIECKRPSIVFNFREFRASSNAIGVFFWQKGRPTIRFSLNRLNHYNLKVTGELEKFVSQKY